MRAKFALERGSTKRYIQRGSQFESVLWCGSFHILTPPRAGTWEPGKVSMDDYFLGRLQGDSAFPLISNHANRWWHSKQWPNIARSPVFRSGARSTIPR